MHDLVRFIKAQKKIYANEVIEILKHPTGDIEFIEQYIIQKTWQIRECNRMLDYYYDSHPDPSRGSCGEQE